MVLNPLPIIRFTQTALFCNKCPKTVSHISGYEGFDTWETIYILKDKICFYVNL